MCRARSGDHDGVLAPTGDVAGAEPQFAAHRLHGGLGASGLGRVQHMPVVDEVLNPEVRRGQVGSGVGIKQCRHDVVGVTRAVNEQHALAGDRVFNDHRLAFAQQIDRLAGHVPYDPAW